MQLQGIQLENGLKARVGAKKSDGTDLTLNTEENAIAKTLGNRFAIPLDFEYFKQPVLPYYLHEDLVVTIELNKPEKVMLFVVMILQQPTQSQTLLWNMTQLSMLGTQKKSL